MATKKNDSEQPEEIEQTCDDLWAEVPTTNAAAGDTSSVAWAKALLVSRLHRQMILSASQLTSYTTNGKNVALKQARAVSIETALAALLAEGVIAEVPARLTHSSTGRLFYLKKMERLVVEFYKLAAQ